MVTLELDDNEIAIIIDAQKVKRTRFRLNLLPNHSYVVSENFGITLYPLFKVFSLFPIILWQGRVDHRELAVEYLPSLDFCCHI